MIPGDNRRGPKVTSHCHIHSDFEVLDSGCVVLGRGPPGGTGPGAPRTRLPYGTIRYGPITAAYRPGRAAPPDRAPGPAQH
eukprot:156344-Hanusia_phi.AAC.1